MTPFDKNVAILQWILEEMTCLSDRLDDMEQQASKSAEIIEALKAENKVYRNVLQDLPHRFFLKDENLRYILCSKIFASDFNRSVDDVIGKIEEDLLPAELAKSRRQLEMRILRLGLAAEIEETLSINGQQGTFNSVIVPLLDDEYVLGLFGVKVDISAQRNEVLELILLSRQLIDLLYAQSEKLKELEKELRDLHIDYEEMRLLRYVESERMKSEFQHQLSARDEIIESINRTFHELQRIVQSTQMNMELLK